ncbi:MAG: hypothetical protein AAGE01_24435 [Pseudomonadota bacterium]
MKPDDILCLTLERRTGAREVSARNYAPMTKAEVIAAQRAWATSVVDRDVDRLLDLYDYGTPGEPLLFKPTLTDTIRIDRRGARSYFVGGDPDYTDDRGFLRQGWTRVVFQSEVGPVPMAGGPGYADMGHYAFSDGDGGVTRADYTFCYHKLGGQVLISVHHSSLTWFPPRGN